MEIYLKIAIVFHCNYNSTTISECDLSLCTFIQYFFTWHIKRGSIRTTSIFPRTSQSLLMWIHTQNQREKEEKKIKSHILLK